MSNSNLPFNWKVLTNDGTNVTAFNISTNQNWSGTLAAFNALLASATDKEFGDPGQLDPRTSLSRDEFSALYYKYNSIEKVVRYLNAINFNGIVDVPNGIWQFNAGSRIMGLDMGNIFLRGQSGAGTIFEFTTGSIATPIWDSKLKFGNCTAQNSTDGAIELRFSSYTNEDVDTPYVTTFNSLMSISRQSEAVFENCVLNQGVAFTYQSRGNLDGAQIAVTQFVGFPYWATPYALLVLNGSNVQAGQAGLTRRIHNPNAVADANLVVSDSGSFINLNGNRLGNTGQTTARGLTVSGDSTILANNAPFTGTVTTQYSQAVNTRTNEGLIKTT